MLIAACAAAPTPHPAAPSIQERIVAFDPAFEALVPIDARIETIADGFTWAEGPTWIGEADGALLFTDVPENTLYRWTPNDGLVTWMKPSGYTGQDGGSLREAGANGLHTEADGHVLLADSGTRLLARLDPETRKKTTLIARHDGKRFNSPNDVVKRDDGLIFFTDPPYGLNGLDASPVKELAHNGVYRLDRDGRLHLIDDSLSFPNGVGLSPDGRTLYVSNSDPARPIWMAYTLDARGEAVGKRVFADATDLLGEGVPGLPDGLTVSSDGHLFASGPGGLLVFDADGRRLGRIETGQAISNCAFGDDGHTLYLTSHHRVVRLRVRASGLPPR